MVQRFEQLVDTALYVSIIINIIIIIIIITTIIIEHHCHHVKRISRRHLQQDCFLLPHNEAMPSC